MKCEILIKMDNAAFELPEMELCRILRKLHNKIENEGLVNTALYDSNGNRVGIATIG